MRRTPPHPKGVLLMTNADQDPFDAQEPEDETTPAGPVVAAIGGSGAATGSIEGLLRALTPSDDVAVVLVLQHREALSADRVKEMVGPHALSELRDGASWKAASSICWTPTCCSRSSSGASGCGPRRKSQGFAARSTPSSSRSPKTRTTGRWASCWMARRATERSA